jgi:hypothetical protein
MFDLNPEAPNIMPAKYRSVAVATHDTLEPKALCTHFVGREAFMRTRFIVVRCGEQTALIETARPDSNDLFSTIAEVRVLAGADESVYVHSPETDVGIASQMAIVAATFAPAGSRVRCVVVEGKYSHVSFLLNPKQLRIRVLDIVPPAPSKLADQSQRLLDTSEDLAPILLITEEVDSRDLLESATILRDTTFASDDPAGVGHVSPDIGQLGGVSTTRPVLLPCQVSESALEADAVRFLDQRPVHEDWTLLGCQRSQQIHTWFYGEEAPMIDTCPRQFLTDERDNHGPTLTRCCLLQEGIERRGRTAIVPWGSSLAEVRAAIMHLIDSEGAVWTPI